MKEINPFHVIVAGKHLGSGTYGSCYLGSYRGLDVVLKQLKVKKYSGETQEVAETRVRNELIYEAHIINKLGIAVFHYFSEYAVSAHHFALSYNFMA